MTRNQALQKAVRMYGRKAAVRDDGEKYNNSDEGRKAAHDEYENLAATLTPEEKKARSKELSNLRWRRQCYRYVVGEVENLCGFGMFFVHGQGDTWAQAFAAAEAARARDKERYAQAKKKASRK